MTSRDLLRSKLSDEIDRLVPRGQMGLKQQLKQVVVAALASDGAAPEHAAPQDALDRVADPSPGARGVNLPAGAAPPSVSPQAPTAELLAALHWYANPDNWKAKSTAFGALPSAYRDNGKKARTAIARIKT